MKVSSECTPKDFLFFVCLSCFFFSPLYREEQEEERAVIGPDGTPFDERQPTSELIKENTEISQAQVRADTLCSVD